MLPQDVRDRLAAVVARDRVLLASDFDGVLAPLQDDPMSVRPLAPSVEALRAAAELPGVSVAVVSGRDIDTLARLVGVDERIVLVGSHGGECNRPDLLAHPPMSTRQRALLEALDADLAGVCASHPGSRLEHKPTAVVLHTRGMPAHANSAALRAAQEVASARPGSHALPGKDVLEVSVIETTKGSALTALAASLETGATVYAGDDVTDEKAFAALDPDGGDLTVKVGPGDTGAVCRLPDEAAVTELFATFVRLRRG